MNALRTSRVLIVDDNSEDALALATALAKVGVGAAVYKGDIDDLPTQKHQGIRLAAVDMALEGDQGADERTVAKSVQVLESLIGECNGPYLVIAWTASPDLAETFKQEVGRFDCPPLDILPLDKETVRVGNEFDPELIIASLEKTLTDVYPLELFTYWEQVVHDAATRTVELAASAAGDWLANSGAIVDALVHAAVGKGQDNATNLSGFLEALNQLHFDSVESTSVTAANTISYLLDPIGTSPPASADLKSRLNRHLLIGPAPPLPVPGSVYLLEAVSKVLGKGMGATLPTTEELLKLIAPSGSENEWGEVIPILLEVTPRCDSQSKAFTVARLLAGLAIPVAGLSKTKIGKIDESRPAVKTLSVVQFEGESLSGDYILAWHARRMTTAPVSKITCAALFRLRQQPLNDIQSWLGGHAARPGYLSVR